MTDAPDQTPEETRGLLFAGGAYCIWGVLPLYWRALGDVPPFELTVHRLLWCAVAVAIVTTARGRLSTIGAILRTPRTLATLTLTSVLISANWTMFIYGIAHNRLVEASLGYYLTPVLSFVLGVAFFKERLSPIRWVSVGIATAGVGVQIVGFGRVPWLGLGLGLTFGLYGYFRKRAPVAALDGLLVETTILFPFAVGLVAWWHATGQGAFLAGPTSRDLMLAFGGALTATPLGLFAAGVRRIRLTTLGFLQYLSPTISLLLAVFGFHETFTAVDFTSFALVWTAIVIVVFEQRFRPAAA